MTQFTLFLWGIHSPKCIIIRKKKFSLRNYKKKMPKIYSKISEGRMQMKINEQKT